jgi:hypothetical protein
MRASWLTTLAVVAAASNAGAEAFIAGTDASEEAHVSTIKIGAPSERAKVDRASVSLWVKRERVLATLSFDVSGHGTQMHDVKLRLELPKHSKATAMAVTIDGIRTQAHAMNAIQASDLYKETVARYTDPALLEIDGDGFYRLSVYPITKGAVGTVDITVEFPRPDVLEIEPSGHVIGKLVLDVAVEGRGRTTTTTPKLAKLQRVAIPLPVAGVVETPTKRPHVDIMTSLVAGRPAQVTGAPVVTVGRPSGHHRPYGDLDKQMIRRHIKLAMPRLTYCYERELLRDAKLVGSSILSFSVLGSGKVTEIVIEGSLQDPAVRTCLAEVVASFEFPKTDHPGIVRINYPLSFCLAGS